MNTLFNRLWNADPSKFVGWLISAFTAIITILVAISPALDGVNGKWKIVGVIVFSVIPKLQAALTALRAYKPSTVTELQAVAHEQGQAVALANVETERQAQIAAEKVAAEKAAKKAKRKAAKAEPVRKMSESSTSKVPKK
jgi:hypothetical protein